MGIRINCNLEFLFLIAILCETHLMILYFIDVVILMQETDYDNYKVIFLGKVCMPK